MSSDLKEMKKMRLSVSCVQILTDGEGKLETRCMHSFVFPLAAVLDKSLRDIARQCSDGRRTRSQN